MTQIHNNYSVILINVVFALPIIAKHWCLHLPYNYVCSYLNQAIPLKIKSNFLKAQLRTIRFVPAKVSSHICT